MSKSKNNPHEPVHAINAQSKEVKREVRRRKLELKAHHVIWAICCVLVALTLIVWTIFIE